MQALYLRLLSLLPEQPEQNEGQGLAEYALILVLIAVVCFVALQIMGVAVSTALANVAATI